MTAYLKRLATTLAAYQIADVVSKFIAVLLLPVYTRYIDPAGYGTVELLANGVIFISILVRFGMIEAFLRFYFTDSDQERRMRWRGARSCSPLLATTVVAIVLAAAAQPLSRVVLGHARATGSSGLPCWGCGRSPTSSSLTACCGWKSGFARTRSPR